MGYYEIPYQAPMGVGIVPGASTRGPWCSPSVSYIPLQHMLSDLGFYSGPLNGEQPVQGTATYNAVLDFGRAHGVDLSSGITDSVCEQLINAHNARGAGPAPTPLPSTSPAAALKRAMTYRYRREPTAQQRSGAPPNGAALVPAGTQAGWWGQQSTAVKAGIIVGGVAVLGYGAYALSSR